MFVRIVKKPHLFWLSRSGGQATKGAKASSGASGYVTLLLSVKNAQKIQLAKKSNGSLSLSLRGQKDEQNLGSETMAVDSLLRDSDIRNLETVEGITIDGKEHILQSGKLVKLRG